MKRRAPSAASPASPRATASRRGILLVDDHPFMRAGLAQLIDRQPDLRVCGEAGDPVQAMRELARTKPDLVLTDLTMPGRGGLEFIKDLRAANPDIAILVISMHDEAVYAERALRAGARGYIMKGAGGENLLTALRQVLGGEVYVSPQMSARILQGLSGSKPRGSTSPIEKLTDREFEIFQLIGQGKSTRDIAQQLHLSPKTVDVHRSHLKEKLELKDATALIRHAVRWVETQGAE
ncbi:MAG TPA: response regulator transcription factor [Opitutus sp.]|nr:response regulator transcription factor [Opitutus sp.]